MKRAILWVALAMATAWPMISWSSARAQTQHDPHGNLHTDPHNTASEQRASASAGGAAFKQEPIGNAPHGDHAAGAVPGHGEAHGEGHAESHGGDHHAPAPINWTDFGNSAQPPYVAMVINLAILIALYYWLGRKPIAQALKDRRQNVAKEIEEAHRMREEAEQRAVMYQAKLAKVEEERETTRQALIEVGKNERDRVVREAEEKAARMQKDAQFLIEQELKQLRQDLWREAVEMATTAAEELLKKRITPSDHERLAEEYLRELSPHGAPRATAALTPQEGAE